MKNEKKSDQYAFLSEEGYEQKIIKLEFVISALSDFLLTSKSQVDEFNKLISSLEALLWETMKELLQAGYGSSVNSNFLCRISDGIATIKSVGLDLTDES